MRALGIPIHNISLIRSTARTERRAEALQLKTL
jgi:hypothetical protein